MEPRLAALREDLLTLGADARLLVAVSGGPDSLALLLLVHRLRPDQMAAATVDHGLRPSAAGEAAMVARVCADLGIEHAVLVPELPLDPAAGNLQARARAARYDALAAHARATGCAAILTAHHLDDQAETVLMRAARGSGVDGLAGVRVRGEWNGLPLFRPLLGWRRQQLAEVLAGSGLTPADDPTNRDPAHDRTRIRALIAASTDLDAAGLARSASALAEAADALRWTADQLAGDRIGEEPEGIVLDPRGLPADLCRRLLVMAIVRAGAAVPRGPAVDRLLAALATGRSAPIGSLLVVPAAGVWHLRAAPPRSGYR